MFESVKARLRSIQMPQRTEMSPAVQLPKHATDANGVIPKNQRDPLDVSSQHGETTVVLDLLADDDPKWLVDVGAHNGVSLSNTYPMILNDWKAILIEPLSDAFQSLTATYAGHTNAICVQMACGDKPGTAKLYFGSDEPGQMSSLADAPLFRARRRDDYEEVQVDTLTNILREHGVPQDFSLLSVDAEGMDFEVLRGLDFRSFRPRILITEDFPDDTPKKDRRKHALLRRAGYTLYGSYGRRQDGCNTMWVLPELTILGD